jgi:autotransporter-associated beta strand protein
VLLFGGLGSSGSTPALIVEQGGIYDMVNSGSRYVSSLAGGGSIFSSMVTAASGTSTLNIAGTSGTTNFSGTLADAPSGAASLALSKSNGATQILSGANTYTGSTSVSSGILIVSGSLSGTTAANVTGGEMEVDGLVNNSAQVTLSGSGELSGSGSVGSITASGGVIAPGFTAADAQSSTGTLSTGGAVMLSSSTSFDIRLGLSASGTDSDMLAENGSGVVTLGGRLNLTIGSGVSMDSGLVYVIINGGSHPVSGTFAGLRSERRCQRQRRRCCPRDDCGARARNIGRVHLRRGVAALSPPPESVYP